jgi:hypothetical protein
MYIFNTRYVIKPMLFLYDRFLLICIQTLYVSAVKNFILKLAYIYIGLWNICHPYSACKLVVVR